MNIQLNQNVLLWERRLEIEEEQHNLRLGRRTQNRNHTGEFALPEITRLLSRLIHKQTPRKTKTYPCLPNQCQHKTSLR